MHGIVQRQYYKWRDLLLNGADRLFVPDPDKEKERLKRENTQLKTHIG
jgi:transposase-like protein